jgi:uncharacterized GH25 family protein/ketosteroid isomerase-like protein
MKPFRLRRSVGAIALAAAGVLVLAGVLAAHDFWIVPNAFAISDEGTIEIRGQTGTRFATSTSAVTPDRIADARVIGSSGDERITDLTVSDKSLLLRHRPTGAGQRIIAVALHPRVTRTTPANLKRYIALEGNTELAERYDRDGAYGKADSLTQRAAKYAKTIVEVGRGGPRAFSRVAGHALELVPLADPATLRAGDSLAVRLLFRGQPVGGAHLHAGAAVEAPVSTTATRDTTAPKDLSIVTNDLGIAKIPLERTGLWNVRALHAAPVVAGVAAGEWEVAFATFVFSVGSSGTTNRTSSAARDSADVVAVVTRYHHALATGDSSAALALLAADAVVLESGDVETRQEYRSNHLPADMSYARAVPSVRGNLRVAVHGDVAWASSTSTSRGQFHGRQINSSGAELMVLSRESDGWKIRAIHWSSRTRRQ